MRDFSLSLRVRVLLLVGVLFAVFLGVEWLYANSMRRMRLEFVRQGLLQDAQLFAAKGNRVVDHARGAVEGLVNGQQVRPTLASAQCQSTVTQRDRKIPQIANILTALPDGRVICLTTPGVWPVNIANRPYFQQALASPGVVVGETIVGRISGRRVLPVIEAVRDAGGRPLEVVAIFVDLAGFATQAASSEHPAGATFGLFDAKGRVLVKGSDAQGDASHDIAGTALFRAVAARGAEGAFDAIEVDGARRLYGVARFTETAAGPIWLWYGISKHSAIASIEHDFIESVAATLGLLLATLAVVWAGGARLVLRPVSVLAAAARRMGQGDLSARSGLAQAGGELGTLAKSFDDMAASLEARSHDVLLATRAVKVLSRWNEASNTARDEKTLLEGMCRAIVEAGSYRGAIVGFAKSGEQKSVVPMASWGLDLQFVANLGITWADDPRGRGPMGTAIRRGATVVMNDTITNPDTSPWREDAQRYHLNAVVALPLKVDGAVIGALAIYAAEAESFGEQEVVLLTEVSAALVSGIAGLRARAARARLEVSLQTSEELFRAAADASPDALFVFKSVRDSAGNIADLEIIEMNARAAKQIGIAREEAIGKTYVGLLPLYATQGTFDKYVQVATTGTRFEGEFSYDVPQKGQRWFRQQVVRVGDGIAISLRDITAWKTAGDKIREAEERMRLALEAARMGAWSADIESDTYTLSEETGPIFGLPKGAGPRSTAALLEAVHRDDREALVSGIERSRTSTQAARREFRVVWPDGTLHWVETHGNVICDEAGKPVRTFGVFVDITQRKLDIAALQRANRALKTLSAANEVLIHATSESELLHDVCRVAVEAGGYGVAWVGFVEHDPAKTVRIVAQYGSDEEYLGSINVTWADTEYGRGPTGAAIRTGTTQVNQNTRTNPNLAPWRDGVLARSLLSSIAMPLNGASGTIGALTLYAREVDAFSEDEVRLLQELAADLAFGIVTLRTREERDKIALEHEHHAEILRRGLEESIQAIAATVEARDPYTSGHQKRVADIATAIATAMGLDEDRIHGVHLAGVLHDLGKLRIPAEILSKPGKLSSIEYELIKGHSQAGYDILKDIHFPWPLARVVWEHHERVDGSGYPRGIKGDEMLLESRIMAVADVVEAMASHRPYRASLGIESALKEIQRGRGTAYDPVVVDACLKLFREGGFTLPT